MKRFGRPSSGTGLYASERSTSDSGKTYVGASFTGLEELLIETLIPDLECCAFQRSAAGVSVDLCLKPRIRPKRLFKILNSLDASDLKNPGNVNLWT